MTLTSPHHASLRFLLGATTFAFITLSLQVNAAWDRAIQMQLSQLTRYVNMAVDYLLSLV
jgi:hypothetical protein